MNIFGSSTPKTTSAAPSSNGTHPSSNGTHPSSNGAHPSSHGSAPNRLSSDVSIKGQVTFSSEMVIDGEVEGDITSDGKLTVGENGKVTGDIQVGCVTVQGIVKGDILASARCALRAGATLQGNVEAPRFAVDETASFNGSATISATRG
jgi:cytoskeletal protein CcmA (bactofilin family)